MHMYEYKQKPINNASAMLQEKAVYQSKGIEPCQSALTVRVHLGQNVWLLVNVKGLLKLNTQSLF